MSWAVHPQLVKRGQLNPALDFQGEVAGSFANRDEMMHGNYDLALRDHDAVYSPAIYDAGDPASKIATNDGIHDVSRQANGLRDKRFFAAYSHADFSLPHKARKHQNTNVQNPTQYFRLPVIFRPCAASCASSVQGTSNSSVVSRLPAIKPASVSKPPAPADAGNHSVSAPNIAETAATTINLTGKQIVAADNHLRRFARRTAITTSTNAHSTIPIGTSNSQSMVSL